MQKKDKQVTRTLFFNTVKKLFRPIFKQPKVINFGDGVLPERAIYVSNHCAANGPLTYELYFPNKFYCWGTYEMCFGIKDRWKYLTQNYFPKKLHFSPFLSYFVSIFALPLTSAFYKGMRILPTYRDMRLMGTMKKSIAFLKDDISVLIFPEDSSDGYHDILKMYYPGFAMLSQLYLRTCGEELPIINMYLNTHENVLMIDKPHYLSEPLFEGKSKEEVAEWFKDRANELNAEFCKSKKNK